MKNEWIDAVLIEIAGKAGIDARRYKLLEQLEKHASAKLRLPRLARIASEDTVSYVRRLVVHFGLGRRFDARVSDSMIKRRARQAWSSYKSKRMGLR
jgi:hypothetical protein